jgi:hypothetical protein
LRGDSAVPFRYPVFHRFDQLLEISILKQNLIGLRQNGLGGNIHFLGSQSTARQ